MQFERTQWYFTCAMLVVPLLASFALEACARGKSEGSPPSNIGVAVHSVPNSPAAEPIPTAGVVICGKQTCDLATSYCVVDSGCRPKGSDFDPDRVEPNSMLCDDASDCQAGSVCCMQGEGGEVIMQCSAPPCSLLEVCVPGGVCSTGRHCLRDETPGTGASCQPAFPGAPCGKQRCGGDRPVCCWDRNANKGSCVASHRDCPVDPNAEPNTGVIPYRCGSKADCAGYYCLGQTFTGSRCMGGGLFDYAMCETLADCPERELTTWEPFTHCRKDGHGFGWCATVSAP